MSFLDSILGEYGGDLAIDLGTANTLVSVRGEGIVINEPSVVAIDQSEERVLAVGADAKRMVGRTPGSIKAIRPLKDGVISDFDVTEVMLRYFIEKASKRRYPWSPRPRVVVCVPSGVTSVEKRAVFEATVQAGARQAFLIEEPMAAAIGSNLPIEDPTGTMVVDIGGGTTEVAVIAMGGIVVSQSIRTAGDEFDQVILEHVRDAYNLSIGERTAEDIKIKVGSAAPLKEELDVEVNGRDVMSGLPKTVRIESEEIRRALNSPLDQVTKAVKDALDVTPPDLASDLMYYGIMLTGGGGLLRGLDQRLREETGVPVNVSPTALENVVLGCAKVLEANALSGGFVQSSGKWVPAHGSAFLGTQIVHGARVLQRGPAFAHSAQRHLARLVRAGRSRGRLRPSARRARRLPDGRHAGARRGFGRGVARLGHLQRRGQPHGRLADALRPQGRER